MLHSWKEGEVVLCCVVLCVTHTTLRLCVMRACVRSCVCASVLPLCCTCFDCPPPYTAPTNVQLLAHPHHTTAAAPPPPSPLFCPVFAQDCTWSRAIAQAILCCLPTKWTVNGSGVLLHGAARPVKNDPSNRRNGLAHAGGEFILSSGRRNIPSVYTPSLAASDGGFLDSLFIDADIHI